MSAKRRLNTETILNTAAELVEENGLENVSLLQVAEKLGVKSPSLYNHFSGFKELSLGIARLAISRLGDTIRSAAVGRSKGDALMTIALAYRKFARENPELYKAILRFPAYNDRSIQEAGHAVVHILYQVMESYHYSKEKTIHFVRGFRSALHGFVSLEEVGFFQSTEADVDKSFEQLVSCLISTLNTREDN
ncbi:TetR/AcrR family transcriptional regulator [Clostridium sp. MT-14]|jgi:AcrR family transcriptional regulator|uniref:TetR/AcrR family transcriptional regulator n=1 Tax=Clostridium aromativorans TaxID=2836848 RepID=A0ABS8NA90_9CLOT|nr:MULTISPECIES: TetR/AcrR family transcriptional regulator [Clostridium]KAA8667156.1 TetR/AcrR family transcriptional regulator [Clostridium sp. HV4-5-A1G]MCC9295623.1 TetR/AcrR family transcriptional regulator [Clostridium aromativorans]CAB1250105.1 TetR family transcriptional regulator [Clostridiaceae bacterium BL-3]